MTCYLIFNFRPTFFVLSHNVTGGPKVALPRSQGGKTLFSHLRLVDIRLGATRSYRIFENKAFAKETITGQLQSRHVRKVILKLSSSSCQAIKKLDPTILEKFILSPGTGEVASRKFQDCRRVSTSDMKFLSRVIFIVHLKNELKIEKKLSILIVSAIRSP